MSSPTHNDKIRGTIAVLVAGVFCGIPVISVVATLSKTLMTGFMPS